jgi:hypothetical protein
MLRHVLGDSVFFLSLRAYATHPQLKYSTSSTKDFERVCENISGKNLSYFFQEWIYGEGFPDYEYSWDWKSSGDSSALIINIKQPADRTNPTFFTMPIDVRITVAGRDTTINVFNNVQSQTFTMVFPAKPNTVFLDPEGWILKSTFTSSTFPPADYLLEQNYPNPFNLSTTVRYGIPVKSKMRLVVYNVLGQIVSELVNTDQDAGWKEVKWRTDVSTGIYFYRLDAVSTNDPNNRFVQVKKMLLLR